MADTKDRLGQRLQEREKAEEDRFFAEKERAALDRLRQKGGKTATGTGQCPRCGTPLDAIKLYGVDVLECPADCGHWLDKGEIELVAKREQDSWIGRLFYRPKLEE